MSDNHGINGPKNKDYLNSVLKKLSQESIEERAKEIDKRIDSQLSPNNPKEVILHFFKKKIILIIISLCYRLDLSSCYTQNGK